MQDGKVIGIIDIILLTIWVALMAACVINSTISTLQELLPKGTR